MPYQLVHNGVVREFEFYPPVGWHYWHERVFTEDGRNGLPLVIALHAARSRHRVLLSTGRSRW
jgi:hypothetical protein